MLQRKASKPGAGLGKTTGWIHRASARRRKGVRCCAGVNYEAHHARGARGSVRDKREKDAPRRGRHVVLCAGQEPPRELEPRAGARGVLVHVIGGADVAAELDAKRAIDQGTRLAAAI